MTYAEFMRTRGYDPETRTYEADETPDLSAARHHKIQHQAT